MKTVTYPFQVKSFDKIKIDKINDKIGKGMDIAFWGMVGIFAITGVIGSSLLIKMLACTGTSKVVKFLLK